MCGFTLIELLVTIAIIAILAGILLPVITSARGMAYKATCQSNLKQLYAAIELYASDWEDTLPCPGGQRGDDPYWSQENGGGVDVYLRNQSAGKASVYCCPSYSGPFGNYSPRTYAMNTFLREPADTGALTPTGINRTRIVSPSQTILLYEGYQTAAGVTAYGGDGYVFRCGDWSCARGYYPAATKLLKLAEKPCHNTTNNYLFCDGHVSAMTPERYPFRGPLSSADNRWFVQRLR